MKSWTQTLADVLWPATSTSESQSGHSNEQNQGTPLQPSWMANTIRNRGRKRQRKGRRAKGKELSASDSEDLNVTTAESEIAKELGLCALDSWNMNTWHAGAATIYSSSADAVLLQETRTDDIEACQRAEDCGRARGWSAKINKAITTADRGSSAGVAIMTKKHIGMKSNVNELVGKRTGPESVAHG